jgi:hypothetical protein
MLNLYVKALLISLYKILPCVLSLFCASKLLLTYLKLVPLIESNKHLDKMWGSVRLIIRRRVFLYSGKQIKVYFINSATSEYLTIIYAGEIFSRHSGNFICMLRSQSLKNVLR